jgi:hypothetical protein
LTIPTSSDATSQGYQYPIESIPASLVFTNVKNNSEIRIYRTSDNIELYGEEDVISGNFAYDYVWEGSDVSVYARIHCLNYQWLTYENMSLVQGGINIPIVQQYDRQYLNP